MFAEAGLEPIKPTKLVASDLDAGQYQSSPAITSLDLASL